MSGYSSIDISKDSPDMFDEQNYCLDASDGQAASMAITILENTDGKARC